MNLRDKIMNLTCLVNRNTNAMCGNDAYRAYTEGHQDALHSAAELASEHDAESESLRREVEACFDIAQRLDADKPTLAGAFTGAPSERILRHLRLWGKTPDQE